jgi:hypothetical protein
MLATDYIPHDTRESMAIREEAFEITAPKMAHFCGK